MRQWFHISTNDQADFWPFIQGCSFLTVTYISLIGTQWLSGRVLDSRPRGRGFEPHRRHCVVSLSKNINPSLVLVQPRKTRPFITERLLMGRKESNKNKQTYLNIFFSETTGLNELKFHMKYSSDKHYNMAICFKLLDHMATLPIYSKTFKIVLNSSLELKVLVRSIRSFGLCMLF